LPPSNSLRAEEPTIGDRCPRDRIDGRQEAVSERTVFSEESQEEMLGLNARSTEITGFVAGEKDHAAGFFGIALEYGASCWLGEDFGEREF
jgi:hypothetical protein